MKIAVMVTQFPCRSETFILNQIMGLLDKGHEVHIYATSPEKTSNNQVGIEKNGLGNVPIFYFNKGKWQIPRNRFIRLLKAFGILNAIGLKHTLSLLRSVNVAKYGRAAASFSLFCRGAVLIGNGPYDIVHCHFGENGNIAAPLKDVGIISGKVITTFYGYDISEYVKRNGSKVYDLLFSKGDLFVVICKSMREQLLRLGCREDKIVFHKLGVDLSHFTFLQKKALPTKALAVLAVGRFVEKKGFEFGIRGIALAVEKCPNISCKIVGDGELRDEIAQLIARLNLSKHVEMLGWKTPEEVAKLMERADLFLAPSVTSTDGDQEGTPTVIIEAMARGLPVLATYHSGIPDLIENGRSGYLVPERDPIALAEKLVLLYKYPERCREMGVVGRDWVEQNHDISKLNNQLVDLYKRLDRQSLNRT